MAQLAGSQLPPHVFLTARECIRHYSGGKLRCIGLAPRHSAATILSPPLCSPTQIHSNSTLRYGVGISTAKFAEAVAEADSQYVEIGARSAKMTDLTLVAGATEEVGVEATEGSRLCISLHVLRGGDIDFGVTLVPRDDPERPIRLYGPTRRTAELHTSFVVPKTGTCYLGFDASGGWWRSKQVSYAVECRADEQA